MARSDFMRKIRAKREREERELISQLPQEFKALWNGLTQAQRKLLKRTCREWQIGKHISKRFEHEYNLQEHLSMRLQILIALAKYCLTQSYEMNEKRWRVVAKYSTQRAHHKTSNAVMDEFLEVVRCDPKKRKIPIEVKIIDSIDGNEIITFTRKRVKGQWQWMIQDPY
jgi:hypothetical protein